MRLIKILLATALVLDAALVMSTTAVPSSTPAQAIGVNDGTGSFSQANAATMNHE